MGDKEACGTGIDSLAEDAEDCVAGGGVEGAGGFVGKQDFSGADEGSRDGDALGLAAGDLFGEAVVEAFEADFRECDCYCLAVGFAVEF